MVKSNAPNKEGKGLNASKHGDDKEQEKSTPSEGTIRPSIRLCLIRHAESKNNEVYRDARHIFKGGTPEFDLQGWTNYVDEHRSHDPGISSKGKLQAQKLAQYLAPHLDNQASSPIQIITSPMRRTMETILPTLRQVQTETEVVAHGLYFESEGCHIRDIPLPGMNQHEITEFLSPPPSESSSDEQFNVKKPSFVGFDEDPNMGWYAHGTGPETRAESEVRASAFYTWLLDYLDVQLQCQHDRNGLFDAGVTLPDEVHEKEYDQLSPRQRKRRTAILVGHGDFMGLVLKRIVAGFGFSVEHHDVSHRSAMVHFNTGITELEYFGKGRFLIMKTNSTPHLMQDMNLLTGGGLKDGWSYLMPHDLIMLYEEVSSHFADEIDGHIKEQTEALKNLYVGGQRGSLLERKNSELVQIEESDATTAAAAAAEAATNTTQNNCKCEMIFVVKRGQKVVGCVTYDDETGCLSDMAIRPSVEKRKTQKDLIEAVVTHAKKAGRKEIYLDRLAITDNGADVVAYLADQGFVASIMEQNAMQGNLLRLEV